MSVPVPLQILSRRGGTSSGSCGSFRKRWYHSPGCMLKDVSHQRQIARLATTVDESSKRSRSETAQCHVQKRQNGRWCSRGECSHGGVCITLQELRGRLFKMSSVESGEEWINLESWKSAIQMFMEETCTREKDKKDLLRKFAEAAQNVLQDAPEMREDGDAGERHVTPSHQSCARKQTKARKAKAKAKVTASQDDVFVFSNIPAVFSWASDLKTSAIGNLVNVVPQQVMDSQAGIVRDFRVCLAGVVDSSSEAGLQRSTSTGSGTSVAFQKSWKTFLRVMTTLKERMEERHETLKEEWRIAGCEERAEKDLTNLIRVIKDVSDLLHTAGIDDGVIAEACAATQNNWKTQKVQPNCGSVCVSPTTVHELVELFNKNLKLNQHRNSYWADKYRQLDHFERQE